MARNPSDLFALKFKKTATKLSDVQSALFTRNTIEDVQETAIEADLKLQGSIIQRKIRDYLGRGVAQQCMLPPQPSPPQPSTVQQLFNKQPTISCRPRTPVDNCLLTTPPQSGQRVDNTSVPVLASTSTADSFTQSFPLITTPPDGNRGSKSSQFLFLQDNCPITRPKDPTLLLSFDPYDASNDRTETSASSGRQPPLFPSVPDSVSTISRVNPLDPTREFIQPIDLPNTVINMPIVVDNTAISTTPPIAASNQSGILDTVPSGNDNTAIASTDDGATDGTTSSAVVDTSTTSTDGTLAADGADGACAAAAADDTSDTVDDVLDPLTDIRSAVENLQSILLGSTNMVSANDMSQISAYLSEAYQTTQAIKNILKDMK